MSEAGEFLVATHNIQVGIGSHRAHHLLLHGWRYIMPHGQSIGNLERIAESLKGMDIVGLNEVDAGSYRSQYLNQAAFLSEQSGLRYWVQQRTRDWGELAQHSNSLLSRWPILETDQHGFSGTLRGRGLLSVRLEVQGRPLDAMVTHLALGKPGRFRQIRQLVQQLQGRSSLVLMGDFNCTSGSEELRILMGETGLHAPGHQPATFPSWSPRLGFDHILCSHDLTFQEVWTPHQPLSDHLALMARLRWVG